MGLRTTAGVVAARLSCIQRACDTVLDSFGYGDQMSFWAGETISDLQPYSPDYSHAIGIKIQACPFKFSADLDEGLMHALRCFHNTPKHFDRLLYLITQGPQSGRSVRHCSYTVMSLKGANVHVTPFTFGQTESINVDWLLWAGTPTIHDESVVCRCENGVRLRRIVDVEAKAKSFHMYSSH
jgi:hypothetical protein